MKTNARLTALLLAILLLVLSCQLPAFAATDEEALESIPQVDSTAATPPDTTLTNPDEMQLQPGDKTQAELQTMTLDPTTVPEVLSYTAAQQKGHVNRIYAQEKNLNTVAFQNVDGTKTAYIYNSPVKYVDSTGNVRDKSTALTQQSNGYAMLDNSVRAYFSQNVTNGICVEYDDYQITMTPSTTDMSAPILQDGRLVYANVFNRVTLLSYQTKLNGVKEEIIAVKDAGQYDYEFTLDLQGLVPVKIDGIWYLKNSQDEIIADLGEVLIADSAGNTATGSMQIEADTAQNTYTLTITVPQDFMQASTTVYPVYIDPTVTVNETGTYIYSGEDGDALYGEYNAITNERLIVPGWDAGSSFHYVYYQLYDFYGVHGQFTDCEYYNVGRVTLNITVEEGEETTFDVIPMMYNPLTAENGVADYLDDIYYMNQTVFYSCYEIDTYSTVAIDGTAGLKSIDITNYVKGWLDADTTGLFGDPSAGLSISHPADRAIRTSDYSTGNDVYYQIDYTDYETSVYINHGESYQFIYAPQNISDDGYNYYSLEYYNEENHYLWIFDYRGDDKYVIRSAANPAYALYPNEDYEICIGLIPFDVTDIFVWQKESKNYLYDHVLINVSNNGVLYSNGEDIWLSTTEEARQSENAVWCIIPEAKFNPLASFEINLDSWMEVNQTQQAYIYIPLNALYSYTYFSWSSDDESIVSIDESRIVTAHQSGSATITALHIPTQVTQQFVITVELQLIPDGTYYIVNKQAGRYLDVEGPSMNENANIQIWGYHSGDQAKWTTTYIGNGYYRITSLYSGKNIATGVGIDDSVVQTSQTGDQTLWRITKNVSGSFKLLAKSSSSNAYCLSIPASSSSNGTNCLKAEYGNDENYHDEWYIADISRFVKLHIKVDKSYMERFPLSEEEETNRYNVRVNRHLEKLQNTYFNYFGIYIDCTDINYSYESYAYSCTKGRDEICDNTTCGDHDLHHSNAIKIMSVCNLDLGNEPIYAVLIFTGKKLCYNKNQDPHYSVYGVKTQFKIEIESQEYEQKYEMIRKIAIVGPQDNINGETKTTVHEFDHMFNALDHYNINGSPSTDDRNLEHHTELYHEDCIHGEKKEVSEIVNGLVICQACKNNINNHATWFTEQEEKLK